MLRSIAEKSLTGMTIGCSGTTNDNKGDDNIGANHPITEEKTWSLNGLQKLSMCWDGGCIHLTTQHDNERAIIAVDFSYRDNSLQINITLMSRCVHMLFAVLFC